VVAYFLAPIFRQLIHQIEDVLGVDRLAHRRIVLRLYDHWPLTIARHWPTQVPQP